MPLAFTQYLFLGRQCTDADAPPHLCLLAVRGWIHRACIALRATLMAFRKWCGSWALCEISACPESVTEMARFSPSSHMPSCPPSPNSTYLNSYSRFSLGKLTTAVHLPPLLCLIRTALFQSQSPSVSPSPTTEGICEQESISGSDAYLFTNCDASHPVQAWQSRLRSAGSATRRVHIARAANIMAVCGTHNDRETCIHACTHVSSHLVVANVVQDELDLDGSRACVHHVIILLLIASSHPSPSLRPAADGVASSPELLQRLICIQERKNPLACTCTTSTVYAHELDVNQQRNDPRRRPCPSETSMPAASCHLSSSLPRSTSKRNQTVRLFGRLTDDERPPNHRSFRV